MTALFEPKEVAKGLGGASEGCPDCPMCVEGFPPYRGSHSWSDGVRVFCTRLGWGPCFDCTHISCNNGGKEVGSWPE
jgi:hypothetical protein